MKIIIFLAVSFGVVFADDIVYHITANDDFDMKALVKDEAKLKALTQCYLDEGPCTEVAQSYKVLLQDVFNESCRRCNPKQKYLVNTYLKGLQKSNPEYYDKFVQKYDPSGQLLGKLLEAVKDY
ncbi:unnamed protein product [Leptidea sinapis]|uniref:Uncharacterized protein n=1 Tax=Leptidea sinapis TaxID=189913 RepID=A0A5E4QKX6_9NEOP|nr:unnamed protein product [Leptidea sinapis]